MEWAHLYVLVLAATATVLLATEKAHLSVIGIGLMVAVALPGLIPVRTAVAGFANPAVVTVAALYVVGEGFLRTGAASILATRILARTGGRESTVMLLIMVMAGFLSAFVNNVLVVIAFLPVITSICRSTGLYPSRLLIPLSYASIVGGMCTLVGTSTNLLVSGVVEESGRQPITMFETTAPGLLLAGSGILYVAVLGRRLLPKIPSLSAQPGASEIHEYVTEITIGQKSSMIGVEVKDVGQRPGGADTGAAETAGAGPRAAMLIRREGVHRPPFDGLRIEAGDILTISGKVEDLARLHVDPSHAVEEETDRYRPSSMSFFELALAPVSDMVGRRVRDLELKRRHGAVAIGLLRNGHHLQARFRDLRMRSGDVLLAFGDDKSRERLRRAPEFHLIEGVDETIYRRAKAPTAFGIVLGVITLFVTGVNPCLAALLGALAMVLSGCLTVHRANSAVNWPILTFIAGTLALSKALEATGTDHMLGGLLASSLSGYGPYALLAGVYVSTMILTELLSNNAVAVIMTPVALAAAEASGIDERLLIMAVVFGASSSFANPMGYKTNLLVYGPGGYRFRDFVRVGLGLDLLLGTIGILVLPWFWPF